MSKLLGRRMEQLEARCLLSVASFSDHLAAGIPLSFQTDRMISGGLAAELLHPQFDLPPYDALPELFDADPSFAGEPAQGDPGYYAPPKEDTEKEVVPDGGGQIELGEFNNAGGVAASAATPAEVRGERESRAVLQMLASLKYPVQESLSKPSATAREFELTDPAPTVPRNTPRVESVRLDERTIDERTIDIAVSEVADEFGNAPVRVPAAGQSRLDLEVQMEPAAGRFQAFEVLTIDPATVRPEPRQTPADAEALPGRATLDQSSEPGVSFATLTPAPAAFHAAPVDAAAVTEATSPLVFLYSLVDEKFGLTWTRVIALVVFGLALQRIRSRAAGQVAATEPAGDEEPGQLQSPCHSGWFARYFKFASRIRAAASS